MRHDRRVILAALLFATPVAACSAAGKVHTVLIKDMAFGPVPAGVKAGDVIEWVNADLFQHTATARNSGFDIDLAPGARGRTPLDRSGEILFYCRYHPGMTGRLLVRP